MSKASQPKERNPRKTRNEILDVAFWEFFEKGFNGASTNEIISKLKVTRGAFFHHFPTKDDLGFAIIEDRLLPMILERWIQPIQTYQDPIDGIVKNFKRLIDETPSSGTAKGCPLNNLTQELSSSRPDFQRKLKAVMQVWIDETQKILTRAKNSGHLDKSTNTGQLAEFIVACQEASFAMEKVMQDRRLNYSVYDSLKRYLNFLR